MKVYFIFGIIVIYIMEYNKVFTKSLQGNQLNIRYGEDESGLYYPVKRKVQHFESNIITPHEAQVETEIANQKNPISSRYRRIDPDSYHASKINLKSKNSRSMRSAIQNVLDLKRDSIRKRDILAPISPPVHREASYGIVYGNGKPVGILEPFSQAYEFGPMGNSKEAFNGVPHPFSRNQGQEVDVFYPLTREVQVNEDSEGSESDSDDSAKINEDKYYFATGNNQYSDERLKQIKTHKRDNQNAFNNPAYGTTHSKNIVRFVEKRDAPRFIDNADTILQDKVRTYDDASKVTREVKQQREQEKLETKQEITDDKIQELKSALNKIQNPSSEDNIDEIENNLKGLLENMGLLAEDKIIESNKYKREVDKKEHIESPEKLLAQNEDEDLENGSNKIELNKEKRDSITVGRKKRGNDEKRETENINTKSTVSFLELKPGLQNDTDNDKKELSLENDKGLKEKTDHELKSCDGISKNDLYDSKISGNNRNWENKIRDDSNKNAESKRDAAKINAVNYQAEGEDYIRSKRQEKSINKEGNKIDIIKRLESSGELTVSGNKSPLASTSNEVDTKEKLDIPSPSVTEDKTTNNGEDDQEFEKRIQRNIQEKINAIKEQVKREINELRLQDMLPTQMHGEPQRKKRSTINTLLDQETNVLDPQNNFEETLKPLVRRRRNLKNITIHTRRKRDLHSTDLEDIDSDEYLDLTGDDKKATDETSNFSSNRADGHKYENGHENIITSQLVKDNTNNSDDKTIKRSVANKKTASENSIQNQNIMQANYNKNLEQSQKSQNVQLNANEKSKNNARSNRETANEQAQTNSKIQSASNKYSETNINKEKRSPSLKNEKKIEKERSPSLINRSIKNDIGQDDMSSNGSCSEDLGQRVAGQTLKKEHTSSSSDGSVERNFDGPNSNERPQDLKQMHEVDTVSNGLQKDKAPVADESVQNNFDEEADESNNKVKEENDHQKVNIMQANSENNEVSTQTRKRRQIYENEQQFLPEFSYKRRKRANALQPEGNVAYLPYRSEDDEVDDESDEFDDDGFDDRTSSLVRKRQANYEPLTYYENPHKRSINQLSGQYYESLDKPDYEGYYTNLQGDRKRRSSYARGYAEGPNSDINENPSQNFAYNYLYNDNPNSNVRRKRQNFDDLAEIHGGGPMLNHLAAVKERNSERVDDNWRRKRNFKRIESLNDQNKQQMADLTNTDIFGALPQSYEGELSRFKRV